MECVRYDVYSIVSLDWIIWCRQLGRYARYGARCLLTHASILCIRVSERVLKYVFITRPFDIISTRTKPARLVLFCFLSPATNLRVFVLSFAGCLRALDIFIMRLLWRKGMRRWVFLVNDDDFTKGPMPPYVATAAM